MKLPLQKVSNARELGGLVTKYGTVKRDVFIRSGELSRTTDSDAEVLKTHRLARVIDLRTQTEMSNNPDRKLDGVEYVNISVIRATTFGISYETLDGETIARMLKEGFARMSARNETYSRHMEILYANFVNDEHCRARYGDFLKLLADKPVDGATLWHCSMGKDRVGTCTALLLHCLGAKTEDIFDDYLLTNELTRQNTDSILNKVTPYVSQEERDTVESMLLVKRSYLQTFFDEIANKYGTVDAFVAACGVTEREINLLRENYLTR